MHDFYINTEFPNEESNAVIAGRLIAQDFGIDKPMSYKLQTLFDGKDGREEFRYITLVSASPIPIFQYYDYCFTGHFENEEKTRFIVSEAFCIEEQWEATLSSGEHVCCSGFNPYENIVEGKSKIQFTLKNQSKRVNVNLCTLFQNNALPIFIAKRNARTEIPGKNMIVYSKTEQLGIESFQKREIEIPDDYEGEEENDFV